MKHDFKIRRHGFRRAVDTVCQSLGQWRNAREARHSLAGIARRENGHLLDDIGLYAVNAGWPDDPSRGERHRFWML